MKLIINTAFHCSVMSLWDEKSCNPCGFSLWCEAMMSLEELFTGCFVAPSLLLALSRTFKFATTNQPTLENIQNICNSEHNIDSNGIMLSKVFLCSWSVYVPGCTLSFRAFFSFCSFARLLLVCLLNLLSWVLRQGWEIRLPGTRKDFAQLFHSDRASEN